MPPWKRALDLLGLLFLAPALVPLMLVIALAIRLTSRGPVLFRQERLGLRGVPFTLLKFRTMTSGADPAAHARHLAALIHSDAPMLKLDPTDHRVAPLGRLLRASGLDELPQVFNILCGQMSLVGPRPCLRYEYDQYTPQQRLRLAATPGLTGLWQVSGKNRTTFPEMVALDIRYAQSLSLWQDLSILFRTFPVLFRQTREAMDRRRPRSRPPAARPPVSRTAERPRPATTI